MKQESILQVLFGILATLIASFGIWLAWRIGKGTTSAMQVSRTIVISHSSQVNVNDGGKAALPCFLCTTISHGTLRTVNRYDTKATSSLIVLQPRPGLTTGFL